MYGLQKGSELTEAFVKTADKNVVARWRAYRDEIYLDKLQVQIDAIQQQIDAGAEHIGYPPGASDEVKRAIDQWNLLVIDPAALEEEKAQLEELRGKALGAEPEIGL